MILPTLGPVSNQVPSKLSGLRYSTIHVDFYQSMEHFVYQETLLFYPSVLFSKIVIKQAWNPGKALNLDIKVGLDKPVSQVRKPISQGDEK